MFISLLVLQLIVYFSTCYIKNSYVYAATGYTIKGYIKPDFNFTDTKLLSDFKIQIIEAGKITLSDSSGYFEINNIPPRPEGYSILISKTNYLSRSILNIKLDTDIVIGSASEPIEMWVGDIPRNGVQDNCINILDFTEVGKYFNTVIGDEAYNANCDVNLDGAINMLDISIMNKHFNTASSMYPPVNITKVISTPINSIQYVYDANGRLDTLNINGQPAIKYIYDNNGNLIKKQKIN